MARPGGKEVGRVNIRAVPDSSKFRIDLKKMLDRVERTVNVSLPTSADTRPAESTLKRFEKDWNGRQITLGAGVGTAAARAQLTALTRPRIASVIVRVQKASLAKAAALLAAFSGARVAGDFVKNLTERLENLDRALPKMAVVSTGIANATSVVLNAVAGILSTGSGIVQLLGVLAAAPGILAGMAVGGTTLALALADAKTELSTLAPAFRRLQNVVSEKFWDRARDPIIDFVRDVLPELQDGLANTSSVLGSWATSVVSAISAAFGGGRITAMFEPLIESIRIASTGAAGFAQGLAILGQIGGSYLPRLAAWVADLSNRFGAFLAKAEESGLITDVIEAGITAAKELGSIVSAVGTVFSSLTGAADGSGKGLSALVNAVTGLASIVSDPMFQEAMTLIFEGAQVGAEGLASALGPLGATLSTLAPLISNILAGSGQVLGSFLGKIAEALSSPVFAEGLEGFFYGILSGIQAIAPALPAIAGAFGTLLGFVGKLAGVLGPVLGAVLSALAPILTRVLTAVEPLLPVLGDAFISIIEMLAPLVMQLLDAIAPLIPMLADQLGPVLGPLVEAFAALMGPILSLVTTLITALLPAIGPLLPLIVDLLVLALNPLIAVITAMAPLFEVWGDILGIVFSVLGGIIATISAAIRGDFQSIGDIWVEVWEGIVEFGKSAFNSMTDLLEGLINGIFTAVNGLVGGLNTILDGISLATGGLINIDVAKLPTITLPRLAVGADILPSFGGTAAILGEGGRAETVTDLGRTNRLIALANALAARALGDGRSGGDSYTIVESVSPDATAKAVSRRRNRRQP